MEPMKRKSRMFEGLTTFNPVFGCKHECYRGGCWAECKMAHRLGSKIKCKLCYDFVPHLHLNRLNRVSLGRAPKIFVCAHGDLFGSWVPNEDILRVLEFCRSVPKEMWFFETKNPERYLEFLDFFPENTILSTTIETDRYYKKYMGYAPSPGKRFSAMWWIAVHKRHGETSYPLHVSIEPIMDFDLEILVGWMRELHPIKVAIGYNSLRKYRLPEPTLQKTLTLIKKLETFTEVEIKEIRQGKGSLK